MSKYDETSENRQPQPNRDSAEKDRAEGNMQQARGRIKESIGALAGDEHMKAEGRGDQFAGQARNKKGQWKDRIKSWINRM